MTKRLLVIPAVLLLLAGCKKLAGLDRQEDTEHHPYLLDPHVKMNAWEYLKYRSGAGSAPGGDSVLYLMYQAVKYSGIDTNEYTKTDRTFIFLHNLAVIDYTATVPIVPSSTCYWGYYTVKDPLGDTLRAATSWSDYTPAQVKSWLQYLIVKGTYSYDNLTPTEVTVNTLLPPGTDTLNPTGIMVLERVKTSDGKIRINDFVNSSSYVEVRTGGILTTNGPVHVVDDCVVYKKN